VVDLKANPFNLDEEGIKWVEETLAGMTTKEKVGQLFCPLGMSDDDGYLNHLINDIGIGGMLYRAGDKKYIQDAYRKIQSMAKIPLLLAANTEAGGDGVVNEGTSFGKPMAVAATNDPENAYRMGYVACKEGAALGLNWSFAPIVDIDYNFHNPITNVRTFGSDPEKVLANASRYLDGADENDVAVSIKHFPGDGCDERDQHIVLSVNSKSVEEWDKTYGHVYGELIKKGAKTVMVGHIAQPAYVEALNPNATTKEKMMPASLSKELMQGLLRGKLGFNGLITTDSTCMLGFTTAMPRRDAVPASINAGADMFLFDKSLEEDFGFMMDAVEKGVISAERLDEAVTRILATKASLHLHTKQKEGTLVPGPESLNVIGCEQHTQWAKQVADQAVTLVKDTQNLLPISTERYKRVYLNIIQKELSADDENVRDWVARFEKEGFEVMVRDRSAVFETPDFINPNLPPAKEALRKEIQGSSADIYQKGDLIVFIANIENASNNTVLRLNWRVVFGLGDDAPWFTEEIPTMMISTACPYHLFDAAMIHTYINAYNTAPQFKDAIMDKIMGRSEFKGVAPSDPFCGLDYLKEI